jgi:2-oxoglutarate dehydrogenase E1 component
MWVGTIHVIVNNPDWVCDQSHSRAVHRTAVVWAGVYLSIFHCNGDDPMAVSTAMETAVEWHRWGSDVVIDMVCYRRMGHNELDQPSFTQQLAISQHPSTLQILKNGIEGTLTKEECATRFANSHWTVTDFEASKRTCARNGLVGSRWTGFKSPSQQSRIRETGVDIERLRKVELPPVASQNFKLHRQMAKISRPVREMAVEGQGYRLGYCGNHGV